jgi:hypothetical protein
MGGISDAVPILQCVAYLRRNHIRLPHSKRRCANGSQQRDSTMRPASLQVSVPDETLVRGAGKTAISKIKRKISNVPTLIGATRLS